MMDDFKKIGDVQEILDEITEHINQGDIDGVFYLLITQNGFLKWGRNDELDTVKMVGAMDIAKGDLMDDILQSVTRQEDADD